MCLPEQRSADAKVGAFPIRPPSPTSVVKPGTRLISWDELATHNTVDDAWIAIKGRVYDVSTFARRHPGGDIVYTAAGQDATDVFAGFHAATDAWKLLPPLCIGVVEGTPSLAGVDEKYVKDILEMRSRVSALRLYDSSKGFYAYKIASNVAICATAVGLARLSGAWPVLIVSALLMALFWQQCGWLAHDFLHHQVFRNRTINNIFGVLIGNVFQGFSVAWWKAKHNHHHAVPNVTDAPGGGDPDIDTTPVLFWSEKLIEGEHINGLPQWLLRNQTILYWPILCLARMSWLQQSWMHNVGMPNPYVTSPRMYVAEIAGLVVHHGLFLAHLYDLSMRYSLIKALVYCLVCQAAGGVFLGVVFAVGHNAMDVLTLDELRAVDFVRLQVRTTRNVDPHWFTDWFTGGLNFQVEHHIFPTVPRHHLPKVASLLRAFCLKHSIPYTSESLIEGNRAVCQLLRKVSEAA